LQQLGKQALLGLLQKDHVTCLSVENLQLRNILLENIAIDK